MRPLPAIEEINDAEYFSTVLHTTLPAYNASIISLKTAIHHLTESPLLLSPSQSSESDKSKISTYTSESSCDKTRYLDSHRGEKGHRRMSSQTPKATWGQYEELMARFVSKERTGERRGADRVRNLGIKLTKAHGKYDAHHQTIKTCLCCCEEISIPATRTLPCSHTYCPPCLTQFISPSLKSEAALPPRCCNVPIPSATIQATLPLSDLDSFLQAVYVAVTPIPCRVWCPEPSCSAFTALNSEQLQQRTIHCWDCGLQICVRCKQTAHGSSCQNLLEPEMVLNMLYKYGWRQCIRCHCLLELKEGCRQVKCSCGATFCYICLEPGLCKNSCSLKRLDVFRQQAEIARKKEAEKLEEVDHIIAKEARKWPGLVEVEQQTRAELARFHEYWKKKWGRMHARHEGLMAKVLGGGAEGDAEGKTYLELITDRHQRILTSVEDHHVQQEAVLLHQQALKESKLAAHITRLKHHWTPIIPQSARHTTDLTAELTRLARLRNHHLLEINSLRESQQRIQDDLQERFAEEVKSAMETQSRCEKRVANKVAREEGVFRRAFQRRLEGLWGVWVLRWDEGRLSLGERGKGIGRWRPGWLGETEDEAVAFLISELRSVLVIHYGKEAVDRLAGIEKVAESRDGDGDDDQKSMWEWEMGKGSEDEEEDIDYHDFVRPWKKVRRERGQRFDLGGPTVRVGIA